jgi:hypothetical protein
MTQKATILIILLAISFLTSASPAGGAEAADKSHFNLFNPTPRDLMRELSTDRPDVTESAYTVDAGHVQVEISLVEFVHDEDDELSIAPTNIKVGLLNNMDLQFVFEPYIHAPNADGFGGTQVRLKTNIWGNDGGDTALGVMPYVAFPTADNEFGATDHLEGGIIVPISISLPRDWTLAMMGEIDFLRDADDEGYGTSFLHTVSVSHPIWDELGGYVEYVGFANDDLGATYSGLVGGGLTYGLTPDVQLDAAIYFGISDAAEDIAARIGVSFRI